MKRSLRRRQCSPPLGGIRECRAPPIRAKATEGAEDLEVQAPKDSPAYRRGTYRWWRRELERRLPAR